MKKCLPELELITPEQLAKLFVSDLFQTCVCMCMNVYVCVYIYIYVHVCTVYVYVYVNMYI